MKNIKTYKQFNESYSLYNNEELEFDKVRNTIQSINSKKQLETAHNMINLYKRNCENYIEYIESDDLNEFVEDYNQRINILNNLLKEKEHKYEID